MSRILIVDDEASILTVLGTLLKAEGYETKTAPDGQQALDLLASEQFDLVVSDCRMRHLRGEELLHLCEKEYPTTPFIMLTAYAQVETAIDALKCVNCFDYIPKPFKVDKLLITIAWGVQYGVSLKGRANGEEATQSEQPAEDDPASHRARSMRAFVKSKEEEYLNQVLEATGGDKERAAKALKVSLTTLYRRLSDKSDPLDDTLSSRSER